MTRLIIYVIVLLLAIWAGLEIMSDPGYVLFSFRHWTLETPFWLCVLIIILIIWIFSFLWRLLFDTFHRRGRLRIWHGHRRIHKAHSNTGAGLLALTQGRWKSAENILLQNAQVSKHPLLNYLAAARAAQELGANDRRDKYLSLAHEAAPKENLAIGLTQAQLQIGQGQFEQALATLEKLHRSYPRHKYILKLLKKLYVKFNDGDKLLKLLPTLKGQNIIKDEELGPLKEKIYLEKLLSETQSNLKQLKAAWSAIPQEVRTKTSVLNAYLRSLLKCDAADEAFQTLIQSLKKSWQDELTPLLAEIHSSKPQQQLKQTEQLLASHKHSLGLLNSLANLCIINKDWNKAKDFLQQCIAKKPNAINYAKLGLVYQRLGDRVKAFEAYQEGAQLIDD